MFTLIHNYLDRQNLLQHAAGLGTSILTAETFYKFHSFSLECLAFLATWYVADGIILAAWKNMRP